MGILREQFFGGFSTGSTHFDHTIRSTSKNLEFTVVARVHYDYDGGTRYVSYFVEEAQYDPAVANFLVRTPDLVFKTADATVEMTTAHPAIYCSTISGNTLPFSGRVFLYADCYIADSEKDGLIAAAAEAGVNLQIRDRAYADYLTTNQLPLAFISHDSRDKNDLVRPLASRLMSMLCPVWYDEYSLKVGDSIRESIDKGLSDAPKCIVVLSPNFISNPGWTKAEFNAVMGKHFSNNHSVLLPVWHNVSRSQIAEYSPLVVDIMAIRSDVGIDEVARQLVGAMRPGRRDAAPKV